MWAIKRYQWVLIGIFVFYLIMSMLTPLIHDDLQWANPYGIEMLNEGFQSLNGRYLGNLLEIIAVRLPLFRYTTYSVFALLIIRIIFQYIVDMKRQECERSFTYVFTYFFELIGFFVITLLANMIKLIILNLIGLKELKRKTIQG